MSAGHSGSATTSGAKEQGNELLTLARRQADRPTVVVTIGTEGGFIVCFARHFALRRAEWVSSLLVRLVLNTRFRKNGSMLPLRFSPNGEDGSGQLV